MNFGIIGTNFICDWLIESLPFANSHATAVYSRKKETGDAFAARHNIPLVFDDLDAFLSSDAFDAVYVASPNACHEEQSIRALRAGKHVLCEKPIAPSRAGYLRMCDAARESGCTLMEAMRPVHDTLLKRVKDALPEIGRVRSAHLEFCQYSSRYDRHKAGEYTNAFNPDLSNAAILDIGIYPIETAVWLFGAPKDICGKSVLLDSGFEGAGDAVLAFDGCNASVSYSKIADSVLPSYILGEGGGITIDKLSFPTHAEIRLRSGDVRVFEREMTEAPSNMHEEVLDFISYVGAGVALPFYDVTERALFACDTLRASAGVVFPSDAEDRR